MNTRSDPQPVALSGGQRMLVGASGLVLAGLLIAAACLTPDPTGLGTHEQLGLRPCTFRCLFNIRCPACGMTTAWCHALRGHFRMALLSNTGGLVLFALAVVAAPYGLISAARGQWLWRFPSEPVLAALALALAALTLADWAVRLACN